MTGSSKRNALILLGLVMVITVIIAASLPQLELQPGMPLPRLENNQVMLVPVKEEPLVAISINEFGKVLLGFLLAGSMLYVGYMLLRGSNWKSLLAFLPSMLLFGLLVIGIIFLIMMLLPGSAEPIPTELPVPTITPLPTAPLGPVPPLLIWLVGIGLLATGSLIGVWIFTSASNRKTAMDVVGLEAEKAWQALKTGLDLKDVIVKCYRQMSLALEKEQGIERKDFMTTGEFENLLEAAGVPYAPVHQLTQLFEAVRYGNWQPNPIDEQNAIHCLEAIILYSHDVKGGGLK